MDELLADAPSLRPLLSSALAVVLESADVGFDDADAFMQCGHVLLQLHELRLYAQSTYGKDAATDSAHAVGATGVADAGRDAVIARRASMLQSLDALVAAVDARLEGRAAKPGASGRMLRLVQVAQALEMTVKEVKCAQFVMLTCLGFKGSRDFEDRGQMRNAMMYAGMNSREMLEFLSPARPHIEQGMIELNDEFANLYGDTTIKMPREVLKALYGAKLTFEEFLTIDGTALADVLKAEKGAAPDGSAPSGAGVGVRASGATGGDDAAGATDAEVRAVLASLDLGDDVMLEGQVSAGDSDDADDGAEQGAGADGTDGGDGELTRPAVDSPFEDASLEPYTTDLQYMDDYFALLVHLVKTYNLSQEDDDSGGFTMQQRKPEAIKRELEAKTKQASAKWRHRLALTLRLAGVEHMSGADMATGDGDDTVAGAKTTSAAGDGATPVAASPLATMQSPTRPQLKRAVSQDPLDAVAAFVPRTERLCLKRGLDDMEKAILLTLVGCVISQDVRKACRARTSFGVSNAMEVGSILAIHCRDLESQIKSRRYFYRNGRLVREGLIRVSERRLGFGDLNDCLVEVDRRMLDYLVGLDTELEEMVEGGTCYTPNVKLAQVVLAAATKRLIVDTVQDYDRFCQIRRSVGFDEVVHYGTGLVLLFHGESGTGKTMTANALANHLHKRLLVITLSTVGQLDADTFKFIFREAKIQDAVVFFDECESLFQSRSRGGGSMVATMLTEIERFEGVLILATNRPYDIDEAMHRRIALSIEFPRPDLHLREKIWKAHIPAGLKVADDIRWRTIAADYELSGGFIKNAMLQALSLAVTRERKHRVGEVQGVGDHSNGRGAACDGDDETKGTEAGSGRMTTSRAEPPPPRSPSATADRPGAEDATEWDITVTKEDVEQACRLQVRGHLSLSKLDRSIVPTRGLDDLVMGERLAVTLRALVAFERGRRVLTSQWGFDEDTHEEALGNVALFWGPSGVGKTMASEAVGYETGRPVTVISCAEVLARGSMQTKDRMHTLFRDAATSGAVVVIEAAESLITITNEMSQSRVGLQEVRALLYHVRRYPGIVILLATVANPREFLAGGVDKSVSQILKFSVPFDAPGKELRQQLWRKLVPAKTPIDADVDYEYLASRFDFVGSSIHSAIFKAASAAALREEASERVVRFADLKAAAEEEQERQTRLSSDGTVLGMYT